MPLSESTKPRGPLSCKVDREMRLCWYRTSDRGMWGWGRGWETAWVPQKGPESRNCKRDLTGT